MLVITPFPLIPGVVVRCRPIGVLKMTDEAGGDSKVAGRAGRQGAVDLHATGKSRKTCNELRLRQIQHFFEHYKDLEKGKWVKIDGWQGNRDVARAEILEGVAAYARLKHDAAA